MARRIVGQRLAGLKRIAKLYAKSRIGMAGLVIIVFFVVLAIFAPILAPVPPVNHQVASAFDVPVWAKVFPQYSDLPVDTVPVSSYGFADQSALASWTLEGSYNGRIVPGIGPSSAFPGSILINASVPENSTQGTDPFIRGAQVYFSMSQPFNFSGHPPSHFDASTTLEVLKMTNVSYVYINFMITNPAGYNFSMGSTIGETLAQTITLSKESLGSWQEVDVTSGLLFTSGIPIWQNSTDPSALVFNGTGTYRFTVQILGLRTPGTNHPAVSFYLASGSLHLLGGAYGYLGTDNLGNDVWSQLVWGSQVSLVIGIVSGIGAVALGALAGIAAGYLGGLWDEILSRFTDFILVIPFLPLLFIVTTIIADNPVLRAQIYVWLIVVFVVVSWPFIAKIIRSQVLSVKERPYVEASRAVGGGTGHIIRRHILPNVMGLVYSQVALNVGGFILLDAALDFLTSATHTLTTVSWGIMLTYSLPYAVGNSTAGYVWWWFLPPGISIGALSLAFVLVGYALDSIFNPRLRAR